MSSINKRTLGRNEKYLDGVATVAVKFLQFPDAVFWRRNAVDCIRKDVVGVFADLGGDSDHNFVVTRPPRPQFALRINTERSLRTSKSRLKDLL